MPPWIERVVKRVEPNHAWADITVGEDSRRFLEKIRDRLIVEQPAALPGRSAASDLTVLFWGPDGRIKMIAAEALAKEVDSVVFRVDTSMLISNELAETERTMRRILDAADEAGGVLYFDEADLLFKPTDDDPYPERGGSYLLKRMTKFAGLSIVSVTDRKDVDPALLRRFRYTVSFQ